MNVSFLVSIQLCLLTQVITSKGFKVGRGGQQALVVHWVSICYPFQYRIGFNGYNLLRCILETSRGKGGGGSACVIIKERKSDGSKCLTLSLVAKLSLGVSSDCEPVAHTAGPKEDACSSATLFSVRCLVTMSWWSKPTMRFDMAKQLYGYYC